MSVPEHVKQAADAVTIPTAFLAWLKLIPFSEIAAALAAIYTALRIWEFVTKRRKRKGD